MKKLCIFLALTLCALTPAIANENAPLIKMDSSYVNDDYWEKKEDAAQYGKADWNNLIMKVSNISVDDAKRMADNDPRITFFFYVKGFQMVLVNPDVDPTLYRVFHKGDAVFFTGEPWWGSAKGLADGYLKR